MKNKQEIRNVRCPNCGNPNAVRQYCEYFPYQDESYIDSYIECTKCGYIK